MDGLGSAARLPASKAQCHGEQGGGDGVFAAQLAQPGSVGEMNMQAGEMTQQPADFTDAAQMLAASPALLQGKIIRGGMGTGMPGGGGIRLKYGNPMHVDDVAVDFPTMPIVLAHPSWPWQDEALSIALHKPQVYIDLSGWSPKYFPPQLVQYANTQLKRKVLFGTDYPLITPDRWLADFAKIDIRDDVRPLILKRNAMDLLKLGA